MTDVEILEVFLHDTPIGTITHLPGDTNLFSFSKGYIDNPHRATLSLSFKDIYGELITDIKSVRTRLPPFFANVLPEGPMRNYLASHAKVNPAREFYLLAALGNDLPGAIKVGSIVREGRQLDRQIGDQQPQEEEDQEGILRFSLAGVQLKFSAIWENHGGLTIPVNGVGGSWIVKLPSPIFKGVPQNEYAMLELARRVGIDVPEVALVPLQQIKGLPRDVEEIGSHAFVTKRFDRANDGTAIHIEDFAQVFGLFPERKYASASYRNIVQVIWREIGEEGVKEFIRRFAFNALIGNGDMHLKNWSLIYPDKKAAQLAPAYDFVSTLPYLQDDHLALNFVDSKSFRKLDLEQFKRFACKAEIPEQIVIRTVQDTVERFSYAWKSVQDLPIAENVYAIISKHLETVPFWKG